MGAKNSLIISTPGTSTDRAERKSVCSCYNLRIHQFFCLATKYFSSFFIVRHGFECEFIKNHDVNLCRFLYIPKQCPTPSDVRYRLVPPLITKGGCVVPTYESKILNDCAPRSITFKSWFGHTHKSLLGNVVFHEVTFACAFASNSAEAVTGAKTCHTRRQFICEILCSLGTERQENHNKFMKFSQCGIYYISLKGSAPLQYFRWKTIIHERRRVLNGSHILQIEVILLTETCIGNIKRLTQIEAGNSTIVSLVLLLWNLWFNKQIINI